MSSPEAAAAAGGTPAPPGPGFFALSALLLRRQRNALAMFGDIWRRYGDVVRVRNPLGRPRYLITHPNELKLVLVDNATEYGKDPFARRTSEEVIGTTLFNDEGPSWLSRRRRAVPAFDHEHLARLGPVATEASSAVAQRWQACAATGESVDVVSEMTRLTLSIAARALFSVWLRPDELDEAPLALLVIQAHVTRRLKWYVDSPDWLPLPSHQRYRRALRYFRELVARILDERQRLEPSPDDLFSILTRSRAPDDGGTISENDLFCEALLFLFGGHETITVTLAWAWYLLAGNPACEERLRAELASVLGGREPSVADLPRLPYTQMVVLETLRLYPAVWGFTRSPLREVTIGGYRIPAGSVLFIMPYLTHRHPLFWEEPDRFHPEHFSPEQLKDRPTHAYIPFAAGPRGCIGRHFALIEMQLLLATLAQRFRLRFDIRDPGVRPLVTLRPGVPLRARVYFAGSAVAE